MKLKTKLIPLAVAATTATAIVPITLTSCSGVSVRDISSAEAAKPSFEPMDKEPKLINAEFQDQNEYATNKYVKFVKANPSAFVEDLAWGTYQNWLSFYDNSNFVVTDDEYDDEVLVKFNSELKSLRFGASTPKFSTVDILQPGAGLDAKKTYNTVSFKMKIEVEAEVKTYQTIYDKDLGYTYTQTTSQLIKASTNVEYNNMIFFAFPGSRDNKIYGAGNAVMYNNNVGNYDYTITSTAGESDVDTSVPGWFITISDNSNNPAALYDYYFDDWSLSYSSDIAIEKTIQTGDEKPITGYVGGNVSKTISTSDELNRLVFMKHYASPIGGEAALLSNADQGQTSVQQNLISWFNQEEEQIIANSVLMDTMSYYLSNSFASPTVDFAGNLVGDWWTVEGRPDQGEEPWPLDQVQPIDLSGWWWVDSPIAQYPDLNMYTWDSRYMVDGISTALQIVFDGDAVDPSTGVVALDCITDPDLFGNVAVDWWGEDYEMPERHIMIQTYVDENEDTETTGANVVHFNYNPDMITSTMPIGIRNTNSKLTNDGETVWLDHPIYNEATRTWAAEQSYSSFDDYAPYCDYVNGDQMLFAFPEGTKIYAHFETIPEEGEDPVAEAWPIADISNKIIQLGGGGIWFVVR